MVTIELPDSVAAALTAQAEAAGLRLQDYLARMAPSGANTLGPELPVDEIDRLIDEEATPGPVYTGSYSRADLYFDHD